MKFSEQWLREWVNPKLTTAELAAQLTLAGLEVEAIEPVAGEFTHVVVGEVLAVSPHPDADKLRVCRVAVGMAEPLVIVCGAKNVSVGMKVPTALIGAELPGNLQIKKSKLRGVDSHGMLCSAKELGLTEQADGLFELAAAAAVGKDVRDVLSLNDVSLTLGLTPNRGDCLGVAGIAHEVAALNGLPVIEPIISEVPAVHQDKLAVTLHVPDACPHYCGRIIRGIDRQATTPLWLQERLRRSGVRCLDPIVDVTNYVMLELGQPLHAFDLQRLNGGVHVRMARAGEMLALLNGNSITLTADTLVIADNQQPIALAGIMGGAASAVNDTTVDIFLESAFFAPAALAGKARYYGLHTDASHRFERGVSAEIQRKAIDRATALLLSMVGGRPGPLVEVVFADKCPSRWPILLREARLQRVLGVKIEAKEITAILTRLGMHLAVTQAGWSVTAPANRFDIAIEEDLIEEIARVTGYDNLGLRVPVAALKMVAHSEATLSLRKIKQQLVAAGYQEVITYSFVDPKVQSVLDPQSPAVRLANPLSAEMAVMRTNLWTGLLQTMLYNLNRQQNRLMLFECGLRFLSQPPDYNQVMFLAGLVTGSAVPAQWGTPVRSFDFFDGKGHLEAMMAHAGATAAFQFRMANHPALHPGKTAQLWRDDRPVGWLGALHPQVMQTLGINQDVYLYEIELAALMQGRLPHYQEVSKFPAIRRDISLVVAQEISAQRMQECIQSAAPRFLQRIELFDLYIGEGIDSGRKSISMGLTLQDLSRTLTDTEVEDVMQRIVGQLQTDLGATLRQ
jgi:phenylalanyl-tRNA synthetase beta chain